ncbi:MAG: HAD family hydrolase [Candidatus Aenigmatarchaeota archaeon]
MKNVIIFDFDGTLVNTSRYYYEINNKILKMFGKKPFEDYEKFIEKFTGRYWKDVYKELGFNDYELKNVPELFTNEAKVYKDKINIVNNMDSVIKELHKNYKFGIVSNNFKDVIENILKKYELLNFFDCIVDVNVAKPKPHPDQLLLCIKKLDSKPESTNFVCDTRIDIECGRRAHVKRIIAVSYGYENKNKLIDADIVIDKPDELLKYFR